MRILKLILIALTLPAMAGCSAARLMIRYGDLDEQTAMSESVFLELRSDLPPTVFISEGSTAGREFTIRPTLDRNLKESGYTLVNSPDEATYIIQINHLRLVESELTGGQTINDAIEAAWLAGAGAALAADVLGATDLVGEIGLGVGVLAFFVDAQTKHLVHTLTTDVLVTESIPGRGEEEDLRYHKTQIVSAASKVNLKTSESIPAMINGLSRSLAGLLPACAGNCTVGSGQNPSGIGG